jgi:hypothetical protein
MLKLVKGVAVTKDTAAQAVRDRTTKQRGAVSFF